MRYNSKEEKLARVYFLVLAFMKMAYSDDIMVLRDRLHALSSARDGIVITDPRLPGNPVVYVNDGFVQMTGYDESEILGRNLRFLQGPDTDPAHIKIMRDDIARREPCRVTLLNYRKNGTPFWNACALSPIFDDTGALTYFVGIHSDVTMQKKAEEELILRERAVAAASNGIIICDARLPDMPIVYCNRAFEKMTGYAESEIVGCNCRFLQGPDTDPNARDEIRDALKNAATV